MTTKKRNRLVALLMTLIMMVGACSISLFAFAEEGDDFDLSQAEMLDSLDINCYLHYGDSMSTGYMLGATQEDIMSFNPGMSEDGGIAFPTDNPNTTTHSRANPYTYGSYPSLVAEELGLLDNSKKNTSHFISFAREGLTTNDIHRILDPSYYSRMDDQGKRNTDKAFETLFGTPAQGAAELQWMQEKTAQYLPKADLITFGMGPNDIIISPLFDVLFKLQDATTGNTLYSGIVNSAASVAMAYIQDYNMAAAYQTVLQAADVVGSLPEILYAVGLSVVRGYMSVQQNWEAAVKAVRAVNDHAIIVCVGGYNATRDLQFFDLDMYRVGRNMGIFTTIMNLYWANTCPLRDQYYFVDIRNVDLPTWPTMIEWPGLLTGGGFMGYFMYCSHPSATGHRQIADSIMNTLYQEDGTNTLPVTSLL